MDFNVADLVPPLRVAWIHIIKILIHQGRDESHTSVARSLALEDASHFNM